MLIPFHPSPFTEEVVRVSVTNSVLRIMREMDAKMFDEGADEASQDSFASSEVGASGQLAAASRNEQERNLHGDENSINETDLPSE